MKKLYSLGLIACITVFAACSSGLPEPTSSKYFQTYNAGFGMNLEAGEVFYTVSYTIKTKFSKKMYYKILFEKPETTNQYMINKGVMSPVQDSIFAKSESFDAIRDKTNYKIILELYSDASRQKLVYSHIDHVRFIPNSYMKGM